jgi:NAD-dependent SIR2 family protein deacetylase
MESLKNDTIFFLGAGFSKAAGAPLQSELIEKVLDYEGHNYGNPIAEYKSRLNLFLENAFGLNDDQKRNFNLEDFYTPIDKCINDKISFRGYSVEYIRQISNELSRLISIVIDNELVNFSGNTDFLDDFCQYISRNSNDSPSKKKCSIITTNWDILLDRRIFQILDHDRRSRGKLSTIDHGTHVTGLGEERYQQVIPAMTAISKGGYTVKLYKIHGSLNWLKCPSCDRLYVNPLLKVGLNDVDLEQNCRFCNRQFTMPDGIEGGYNLQSQIIYPTFMKELGTSHFNNIWNSVSRNLSETKCVVFIGYSFQQADFEIRQLLARRLPNDCEIINVGNSPELEEGNVGYANSAQSRYKNFFGGRPYQYFGCGAHEFVQNHLHEL